MTAATPAAISRAREKEPVWSTTNPVMIGDSEAPIKPPQFWILAQQAARLGGAIVEARVQCAPAPCDKKKTATQMYTTAVSALVAYAARSVKQPRPSMP